jgi:hypothetical protein
MGQLKRPITPKEKKEEKNQSLWTQSHKYLIELNINTHNVISLIINQKRLLK